MVSRIVFTRSSCALLLFLAPAVLAQLSPPPPAAKLAADVVVSAEAGPEPAASLGAAATVIEAGEIAASKATTVLDLLRTVPGLDVVQSGGPGTVTSLFLRGTASAQTLVLVDGVALNSPFFGGTDLSALSLANVERVEVVRGPFSALYGSEAIGGVVRIFTRKAPGKGEASGRATFALGNRSAKEAFAELALGSGPLTGSAGFRRSLTDGDLPNEFFAATNVSGSVTASLTDALRVGLVVRRDEGRTGIPFSEGTATPRRSTTNETTAFEAPVSYALSPKASVEASFRWVKDSPTFSDPDAVFSSSSTHARRAEARAVLTAVVGAHRLAAGADWERTLVSNESNFGVALENASTRTFALFAEDRIALAGDRLVATAGLRWDDHSAFGSAVSPRATLAWRVTPSLKLRAAAGSAFRAPSTGELYFPFSGNPSLRPEKSRGWEAGVEKTLAKGFVAEATLFWNDVRDLIEFDAATLTNQNIGRVRTRGVEVALRTPVGARSFVRASYTYLDAKDLDAGTFLVRR
ncbi:MAG TPA: TonB-dependent receptor, partial [Thermoanaerobaculia bacterium]|nr:TonB-dependent receptor [Thermoanaerobaculia bacterium]